MPGRSSEEIGENDGPVRAGGVAEVAAPDAPLCVDLDGTLIKSDTLYDSLCLLMRRHPLQLLRLPGQLLRGGKAAVKAALNATSPLWTRPSCPTTAPCSNSLKISTGRAAPFTSLPAPTARWPSASRLTLGYLQESSPQTGRPT